MNGSVLGTVTGETPCSSDGAQVQRMLQRQSAEIDLDEPGRSAGRAADTDLGRHVVDDRFLLLDRREFSWFLEGAAVPGS